MKFMTIKEYRAQLAQQAQEAAQHTAPGVSSSMGEKTRPAPGFSILSREDARAQGLKRYYTGLPCVKGHDSERYTRDGRCVQCATAHSYEKYKRKMEADPEGVRAAIRESGRRHYERNREKVLDKKRAFYQAKKAQRATVAP